MLKNQNPSKSNDQSEQRFMLSLANENSEWKQANCPNCLKRGKTRMTEARFFEVCIWLVERIAQVSGPITEQSWVNPALLSSLHWKLLLEGKLGLHWLHSKQIYLLRSSSAPLNVNNHMGNFHGIQSLPNYSWRLPAENLIHFVSSLSTRNERKKIVS